MRFHARVFGIIRRSRGFGRDGFSEAIEFLTFPAIANQAFPPLVIPVAMVNRPVGATAQLRSIWWHKRRGFDFRALFFPHALIPVFGLRHV